MVKFADSKLTRDRKAREKLEDNIQRAVDAYRLEQKIGNHLGYRKIASMFGVTMGTLRNRVNGGRSIIEVNAAKQKLSVNDEKQLTELLQLSSDRGLPFTSDEIRQAANALLRARHGPFFEPVGTQWISRFLNRHRSEVKTYWSNHLDMQRAQLLNPTAVKQWFDLVEEGLVRKGIPPELIYGMDESGFQLANDARVRCIGRTEKKMQSRQGGASREIITSLVTICADGTCLKPLVIFKGQYIMQKWARNNVADVRYVHLI